MKCFLNIIGEISIMELEFVYIYFFGGTMILVNLEFDMI